MGAHLLLQGGHLSSRAPGFHVALGTKYILLTIFFMWRSDHSVSFTWRFRASWPSLLCNPWALPHTKIWTLENNPRSKTRPQCYHLLQAFYGKHCGGFDIEYEHNRDTKQGIFKVLCSNTQEDPADKVVGHGKLLGCGRKHGQVLCFGCLQQCGWQRWEEAWMFMSSLSGLELLRWPLGSGRDEPSLWMHNVNNVLPLSRQLSLESSGPVHSDHINQSW